MRKIVTGFLIAVIIISCSDSKNENKKDVFVSPNITMLQSPVGDSCVEPYLFTDKSGIVYLSWIEKIGKQSTLKFSSLVNDKWSTPSIIATGNNWFVNWADYPVLSADNANNLLLIILRKAIRRNSLMM